MKRRSRKLQSIISLFLIVAIFQPGLSSNANSTADLETVVFQEIGSTNLPRLQGTATLLSDGKVLITGGPYAIQAEVYDAISEVFSLISSMTIGRYGPSATLLADGRVLIVGGYNHFGGEYLSSAEIYDPTTGIFSATTGALSTSRGLHTATLLQDGRVLIAGGYGTDGSIYSSAEIYTPETDSFTLVGEMTHPRCDHAAALLPDGKVLLTGGENYSGIENTADIFDPSTNTFSPTGNMNAARYIHTSTLLNDGTVLISGGIGTDYYETSTAEIYYPNDGTFSYTGNMTTGFRNHSATLLTNGKVLVAGGYGSGLIANLYDPLSKTFARTNDMVNSFGYHASSILPSGKVLLVGGGSENKSAELAELIIDNVPPVGTMAINNGAYSTTSRNVELFLSATDNIGAVAEMRFSTDGISWENWIPFYTRSSYELANEDGIKTVFAQLRDYPGNLSELISTSIELNTSVGTEYNLSVNNGALFTNNISVYLSNGAKPFTSQMSISNDGGFAGAIWEPYSAHKEWQITQYGNYVIPRVVYIKYKDNDGNISSVYQDDIILDVTPPIGSIQIVPNTNVASESTVTLELHATDDVSGVGFMRISTSPEFTDILAKLPGIRGMDGIQ
jgi:hypothetical protein